MSRALYREPTPAEREVYRLRRRITVLSELLARRELALGDLRGQLLSFEGRYIRQVGLLYKQLDEWNRKRGELQKKPHTPLDFSDLEDEPTREERAALVTDLRALFRELAKRLHPDFATDTDDERRRTRLMAQANDAFRRADRESLERLLRGFEAQPALTGKEATEAELALLNVRVTQMERDILKTEAETEKLARSEMASLQQSCIDAALSGRDLLAEMAVRVKGLIGLAMRQYELDLDRIKNPPRGAMMESLLSAETATTFRFVNGKRQNRS
ncbi:MAG: hypothetical protein PW735_07575 [Acidobacteriaceae bacterium]|nr:hypothetical protein [Acidobacteriaceae bacterium]